MRKLRHPNIIQFVDVFETVDKLMVIMEFAPGKELFDVILAKKYFVESEAKPIFAQIARALFYLHNMNIIHRDIKPENILILNKPHPDTGLMVAKLLDFGLSKNTETSAGKTFVGTPCYLAPEVEFTSLGKGGRYGTPVDCWSLGAVLYVMLVARFPEFDIEPMTNTKRLKLPAALWTNVSTEAKSLVLSLMCTDPFTRLSMREALQHSWLGEYRATPRELDTKALPTSATATGHPMNIDGLDDDLIVSHMSVAQDSADRQAVVIRPHGHYTTNSAGSIEPLPFAPLLNLQRSVASCFDDAHSQFLELPEVAAQIRKGAVLCREQLYESTKMLRKVEQTAVSVNDLFPDLELAVEEGEPALATEFFNIVRGWVSELRDLVAVTQQANRVSMAEIQRVVETSASTLSQHRQQDDWPPRHLVEALDRNRDWLLSLAMQASSGPSDGVVTMTQAQVMDLFAGLFGQSVIHRGEDLDLQHDSRSTSASSAQESIESIHTPNVAAGFDSDTSMDQRRTSTETSPPGSPEKDLPPPPPPPESPMDMPLPAQVLRNSQAGARLVEALHKLRQMDMILEQLAVFWANTEVVLDVLTKKGQHAEQFIGFAHKPKLMSRFRERIGEYRLFWENVRNMCQEYLSGVREPQLQYGFLEGANDSESGRRSSSS